MAILKNTIKRSSICDAHVSAHRHRTKKMSIRPEVLYGSDFETNVPKDNRVNVWLWSIVRASDGAYIVGESIEEWYETVMQLSGIICFHNLKFDGQFIMDYLIRNKIEFCKERTIIDADGHIPYRIALKDDLFIQDTMRVHAGSLQSVARSYGIQGKFEPVDFTIYHEYGKATEKEIAYVVQDSNIVAQILKADCIANNGYIPLTGAGFAKRKYVEWLKKSKLVDSNGLGKGMGSTDDALLNQLFPFKEEKASGLGWQDLARQSYMGGEVVVKAERVGVVNGKTYVYDVNSAYPFHMANKPIPVGEGHTCLRYKPNKFGIYYIQGLYFRHDNTCPIIHKSRMMQRHLPDVYSSNEPEAIIYGESDYINEFYGDLVLTSIEIEYLKEYANLEMGSIYIGYTFETRTDVFRDYINGIYKERQEIKDKDPVKAGFLKLMMNSLYGKFGSGEKYGCTYEIDEHGLYREVLDSDNIDNPWCYVPVATAITGYERVYIAEIITANWDNFIYCDTDSIHLAGNHKEGSMRIHQKELGALKCESIADASKYLRSKCYIHQNERELKSDGTEKSCKPIEVKCGGMPQNIKDTIKSMDELHVGAIFEGKLMPKKYIGGVYLEPTTFQIIDRAFEW